MTLKNVAEQIGIDTSLLAKIERNERQPTKQIIKQVHFELFNIDVTEIDTIGYKIDKIKIKQIVVLFDYLMESKALEDCKYYKVNFSE